MLMRPRPGNVPFRSSTPAITGTGIVITVTLQSGECPSKQLAYSWQAGTDDCNVVFHGGPKDLGVKFLGVVDTALGREEEIEADYGDHCVAGRILATDPGKRERGGERGVKKP